MATLFSYAVTVETAVLYTMAPCSLVEISLRFGTSTHFYQTTRRYIP